MRIIKGLIGLAVGAMLLACGGGGGDPGSEPFPATGSSAPPGGGTTGGSTTPPAGPVTSGGGISQVATSVPSQRFMSISSAKYNLNWALDGDTTEVQVFVADTAGNPVANGTVVQFSSEGGQIQTSCRTTGIQSGTSTISGCSVIFNTQDFRPHDGLVTIIAWMEGDEAYKDLNGNGKYDSGEPFIDSGRIFRDDDSDFAFDADKDELLVDATLSGAPGIGTAACEAAPAEVNINEVPRSVSGSCDGVWGKTLIRRTITFPVSDPRRLGITPTTGGVLVFTDTDVGTRVAAPAGTAVVVLNPPTGCSTVISPAAVGVAEVGPTLHAVLGTSTPAGSNNCSGRLVEVEAKFENYAPVRATITLP